MVFIPPGSDTPRRFMYPLISTMGTGEEAVGRMRAGYDQSASKSSSGLVMEVAIRCTVPSCSCECFTPGKLNIRYCDGCNHSWVPHALDKLGGQTTVQPNAAFDIASLVLYGCQALPIRLKILLDRLFSVLRREEVLHVLAGFGWTHDDYARGYILQLADGTTLERWHMCSAEEEPLVLRQFLRFGETRGLALQLLAADVRRGRSSATSPTPPPVILPPPSPPMTPPQLPPAPPSIVSRPSPLNRLQNMHPVDYGKSDWNTNKHQQATEPSGYQAGPINLSTNSRSQTNMSYNSKQEHAQQSHSKKYSVADILNGGCSNEIKKEDDITRISNLNSALNLSRDNIEALKSRPLQPQTNGLKPSPPAQIKRHWRSGSCDLPINLGTQIINPTTGKKRVQCNVCFKTFCDKGALKIHFSAVHLREMHKCTVDGCSMMFSSRRSRNRHSANPNPKLHSPYLRRKMSPHDGRSAQARQLLLPPPASTGDLALSTALGSLPFPPFPLLMPPPHLLKQSLDMRFGEDSRHDIWNHTNPAKTMEDSSHQTNSKHEEEDIFDDDEYGIVVDGDMDDDDLDDREETDDRSSKNEDAEDTATNETQQSNGRKCEEFKPDGEPASNTDSNDESVISSEQPSTKNELPAENLVMHKSSRKRKNKNPTRCMISNREETCASLDEMSANEISSKCNDEKDECETNNYSVGHVPEKVRIKSEPMENDESVLSKTEASRRAEDNYKHHDTIAEKTDVNTNEEMRGAYEDMKHVKLEPDYHQYMYNASIKHEYAENFLQKNGNDQRSTAADLSCLTNALQQLENLSQRSFNGPGSTSPTGSLGSKDSSYDDNIHSCFPQTELDPENPRRCPVCGEIFQDMFSVKAHIQNTHMRLTHPCNVQGCKAAFPSRRSRDRHSDNLKLHRKLLSTHAHPEAAYFMDMLAYSEASEMYAKQCLGRSANT